MFPERVVLRITHKCSDVQNGGLVSSALLRRQSGVEDGVGDDAFVNEGVTGDNVHGGLLKVVVEDVIIGAVGDGATDVADGEGYGGNGGNELVRTADLGDD